MTLIKKDEVERKDCPFDCSVKDKVNQIYDIIHGWHIVFKIVKGAGGVVAFITTLLIALHYMGVY